MFDSGVLTTADADLPPLMLTLVTAKQDRQSRYYLPPLMLTRKKAPRWRRRISACKTLDMTSTGVDRDLTDAARHLRFRAEV